MKRIDFIFAVLAAATFASCAEKMDEPSLASEPKTGYVAPVEGATFSLIASASDDSNATGPQSKALFDGLQLVWYEGDALNVFANSENSYEFKFAPDEGADWNKQGNTFYTTEFTPEEGVEYSYTAVFPYEAGLTMDSEGWIYETVDGATAKKAYSLETPTQKRSGNKGHLEKMPLWGTATATGFTTPAVTMHNVVSVIEVETTNNLESAAMEVTKVKFSSDCIVFGGEYYLNAKTGKLELKEGTGKSEIELTCSNLNNDGTQRTKTAVGGTLLNEIAVAPQTVSGTLTVEVTTNQGTISTTRTLDNLSLNAGKFRKVKLSMEESQRNIFVKADADGTGDGSSWEKAFGTTQLIDYIKQNTSDSDNNAIKLDGRNFYLAGGTYKMTDHKIEFNGYPTRVGFYIYGGYDPSSTGTDTSKRDISAYETIFDGSTDGSTPANWFCILGNQTEVTYDGIVFANLLAGSNGCIQVAAGGTGDAHADFTDCTFRNCKSSTTQIPVLLVDKGLARLSRVSFSSCRAEGGPRGLIRLRNVASRVYLNACTFSGNTFGGGGFGQLAHINEKSGILCMYNVTYAGNDTGCSTNAVVNGSGGMLISSSTLVASNSNAVIRCESDPTSGSLIVNNLLIQEKDQKAIDMSSTGKKLLSKGGNMVIGSINANSQYESLATDENYATRSAASALSLSWNSTSKCYLWNGTTTFTKLSADEVRAAISGYSNSATGTIKAGDTAVYDGSKAGEDFLGWLDSIGAFGYDGFGNARSASAHWPGAYQAN